MDNPANINASAPLHGAVTYCVATLDPEAHALWHLDLLGCHAPEDAVAPWVPTMPCEDDFDDGWDEDDDGLSCTRCGGEGWDQVDDPFWDECDEFGYGPCCACHGTGERRHQWVF